MKLRSSWLLPLGILIGLGLLVGCVLWFPRLLTTADIGRDQMDALGGEKLAKAINDVRTTLLQGLGGGVVLLGVYFTWQQLRATREGQVTDRYTKAVDQLDKNKALPVRVGGLYALERIARDSRIDQTTVARVLCAYARTAEREEAPAKEGLGPGLAERAADVQAALEILARWRRDLQADPGWLDLHGAEFQGARLHDAQLRGVHLFRADLQGAHLHRADLRDANLWRVQLQGAHLNGAQLQGARHLDTAKLQGAEATEQTIWPDDWDRRRAERAGVQFVDEYGRPLPPLADE